MKESYILQLELHHPLRFISSAFYRVFTHAEQIIKRNEGEITNGLPQGCTAGAITKLEQEFWRIRLDGKFLLSGWVCDTIPVKEFLNTYDELFGPH